MNQLECEIVFTKGLWIVRCSGQREMRSEIKPKGLSYLKANSPRENAMSPKAREGS